MNQDNRKTIKDFEMNAANSKFSLTYLKEEFPQVKATLTYRF